jgi:hypothetical protein
MVNHGEFQMSSDKNLQEMEAGTKQSKTAVNAGAKPAEPMQTLDGTSYEDLGGPTPDNYRPDDGSAELKDAGAGLKQVKDVVNKGAKPAEPMKGMKEEEEVAEDEEVVAEAEETTEEVVSEEEAEVTEETEEVEEVVAEEEVVEEESFDIEEDVNALLSGEELSEEFQEKARTIFEAALRSKVSEIKEGLKSQYEAKLELAVAEEVEEATSALTERVDSYLEYVSQEWVDENKLAIESGLKSEMVTSFMTGMKGLFEEHYVSIPEDKYDVLESMVEKLDDMETKLNEQIEKNVSLNKRLSESVADGIFAEVSEGLAVSQKEKLASLSESVEFESETQYREKMEMMKESYFSSKSVSPAATTETLSEGEEVAHESHSGTMAAYLRTLSSVAKN